MKHQLRLNRDLKQLRIYVLAKSLIKFIDILDIFVDEAGGNCLFVFFNI